MSEPNIVLESSSDDEETISIINAGVPSSLDSQCSICLDEFTNPSNTDSCLHTFCFECLQRWSNLERFCPLCKETFSYIYHSFDDVGVHETYDLPRQLQVNEIYPDDDSGNEHTLRNVWSTLTRLNSLLYSDDDIDQMLHRYISERPLIGQAMRIQVYVNNMWAEPLQETTGRITEYNPHFYRDNPSHTQRLHLFILRDVVAIMESLRLEGQTMPVAYETIIIISVLIMISLFTHEIRQLHLINGLRNILGSHVLHFRHELNIFADSAYDISDYDRNVQFTYRPHATESTEQLPIETIVLNSDNEEVQRPIIITDVSSSTDDSDVVIPSHSIGSIEPLNSASIDQQSTSTEIRDSLNRSNDSFQSVDSGSSHLKRVRPILDFSPDDDDSIIAIRPSKTAHKKIGDMSLPEGNEIELKLGIAKQTIIKVKVT